MVDIVEPQELRAGLTWQWRREDLGDYPASTWTLTYYAKQLIANGHYFSIVASADGDIFAISVPAANTVAYVPGNYRWVAIVTAGSEAHEVSVGEWSILARYDTANAIDDRSDAQKRLDRLWEIYDDYLTNKQGMVASYAIGGRSVQFRNAEDIRAQILDAEQRVQKEKTAQSVNSGRGNPYRFFARFN